MSDKRAVLEKYFGYQDFRPGQEAAIDALLSGQDVLAVMPTGAGKSVCYQIPALLLPGVTLVISPLVSLMKDQVGSLVQMGVPAAFLNSSLTERQYALALARAREGRYKIIYVAPERLDTPSFRDLLHYISISLVAVDEAHCISQWGQDFRPAYLGIPEFLRSLPQRPAVGAFTATATPQVKADIGQLLAMDDPLTLVTGFDRPNLYFEVRQPKDKQRTVLQLVRERPEQAGIVYCTTRKNVDQVCELLCRSGIAATSYHAGLSDQARRQHQDDFLYDRAAVMVATNAFGMGIDKSNVRYVIHYNMPKDLESYYQEAGRAGRDGEAAQCILLYAAQDVRTNEFLISRSEPPEGLSEDDLEDLRRRDRERLRQITFYCHTRSCLRRYILRYFGEPGESGCDNCCNCLHEFTEQDITGEARSIVECVRQCGQRFGMTMITLVLRGSAGEKVLQAHLNEVPAYGALAKLSQGAVRERLDFLLAEGYLYLTATDYPVLTLGPRAGELTAAEAAVVMKTVVEPKDEAAAKPLSHKARKRQQLAELSAAEIELFEALRGLRLDLAKQQGVPPFMIFSDKTLHDLTRKRPRTLAQLREVYGIGEQKAERYGSALVSLIEELSDD